MTKVNSSGFLGDSDAADVFGGTSAAGGCGSSADASSADAFGGLQEIYVSPEGFSRLYRCRRFGRLVVLKALKPSFVGNPFYEQALHKEFSIGYPLEHPHICRTLGWEQLPELGHCILLEYVDGISLREWIDRGLLTRPLADKLIGELCDALSYMHTRQVIHRDLKPENILVTFNGNNVKLIDFGLSDADDFDVLKIPAGTRCYVAPEVLKAGEAVDLRADIFSLGVILGEMAEVLHDASLASVAQRCTRVHPQQRYASASDVAEAVRKARSHRMMRRVGGTLLVGTASLLLLAGVVRFLPEQLSVEQTANSVASVEQTANSVSQPLATGQTNPAVESRVGSERCARLLASERNRLLQAGEALRSEAAWQADSLQVMQRLQHTLNLSYPLPEMRHTPGYRHRWAAVQQSATHILREVRRQLLFSPTFLE